MPMTGNARGQAIYDYLSLNDPNFSKLSNSEKSTLLTRLQGIYGADTSYITSNASVSTSDAGTVTSGVGAGGSVVATGTGTVS